VLDLQRAVSHLSVAILLCPSKIHHPFTTGILLGLKLPEQGLSADRVRDRSRSSLELQKANPGIQAIVLNLQSLKSLDRNVTLAFRGARPLESLLQLRADSLQLGVGFEQLFAIVGSGVGSGRQIHT